MPSPLVPCAGCARHVRAGETCPFCAAPPAEVRRGTVTRAALALVTAVAASASLGACYGGPPHPDVYQPRSPQAQPDTGTPPPATTR